MKLSSQSVRTMFGFGLEQGRVIEALGNSFQRLWNAFIRPHPLFPQTPTNSTVCRVQVLKACVRNCQKLNGSLKGWLIKRTASKLAQMANMNNTCLNKHLEFPFISSQAEPNKDAAQTQLSKFLIALIGSFRQLLIHFNSTRQQYFPLHSGRVVKNCKGQKGNRKGEKLGRSVSPTATLHPMEATGKGHFLVTRIIFSMLDNSWATRPCGQGSARWSIGVPQSDQTSKTEFLPSILDYQENHSLQGSLTPIQKRSQHRKVRFAHLHPPNFLRHGLLELWESLSFFPESLQTDTFFWGQGMGNCWHNISPKQFNTSK